MRSFARMIASKALAAVTIPIVHFRNGDNEHFRFGSADVEVRTLALRGGFLAFVPGHTGAWDRDRDEATRAALAVAVSERIEP